MKTDKFYFILFDGFSNMVLANAMEPLRDVKLRSIGPSLEWHISSLDDNPVSSSSGLSISPDTRIDGIEKGQTVVFVSGYGVRDLAAGPILSRLRRLARNAHTVIGLDTASWLLASAGLLDNHEATIHWQELYDFAEEFPEIDVTSKRFIKSGNIVTCGGASTVLDMILDLIQTRYGVAAAFDASTMFIFDPERQNQIGRGAVLPKHQGSPILMAALNAMASNIENPLSLAQICKVASSSKRTLHRVFQDELGMTPGKYYQFIRLGRARDLARETSLSVEQIAIRCGYTTAQALGRAFSGAFNMSISSVRREKGRLGKR